MSKHTPGPWAIGSVYHQDLGQYAQINADEPFGDIIARVCVSHKANHTLNECGRANARLIAAAPELLEALELLLSYTLACEAMLNAKPAGQIQIAESAIAKATGEHHD